ncbi:MAG: FtsH protease activity modulator HflK [Legionella sp.]|nr:FtsH protease activity modulator HflK [Legionella sp.]
MGWNEPDKGNDRRKDKSQPPDLEEALKRLQENLKNVFLRKKNLRSPSMAPSTSGGGGLLLALIGGTVALLWALAGIFIVDPAEQAVILRFGKYLETVGPGPHWIPRFIESKIIRNVDRVMDYSYSAQMLTKDENLVSVSLAVQYRIGELKDYLFNVKDPQKSLQQATSSALRQVVGTTTFDQIITEGREAWGNGVYETLNKILAQYKTGILIVNVSPQPARAPENVQDAFDDAIKAREDEKRFKEQAFAYQAHVVPLAEGNARRIMEEANAYAQKVLFNAKGEVAEYKALLPEYLRAPKVMSERLYLETMQRVLARSTKVVIENKANNLIYLPLDKWLKRDETSAVLPLEKDGQKKIAPEASDNLLMMTERNTVRRSYTQEGRNE